MDAAGPRCMAIIVGYAKTLYSCIETACGLCACTAPGSKIEGF